MIQQHRMRGSDREEKNITQRKTRYSQEMRTRYANRRGQYVPIEKDKMVQQRMARYPDRGGEDVPAEEDMEEEDTKFQPGMARCSNRGRFCNKGGQDV